MPSIQHLVELLPCVRHSAWHPRCCDGSGGPLPLGRWQAEAGIHTSLTRSCFSRVPIRDLGTEGLGSISFNCPWGSVTSVVQRHSPLSAPQNGSTAPGRSQETPSLALGRGSLPCVDGCQSRWLVLPPWTSHLVPAFPSTPTATRSSWCLGWARAPALRP